LIIAKNKGEEIFVLLPTGAVYYWKNPIIMGNILKRSTHNIKPPTKMTVPIKRQPSMSALRVSSNSLFCRPIEVPPFDQGDYKPVA